MQDRLKRAEAELASADMLRDGLRNDKERVSVLMVFGGVRGYSLGGLRQFMAIGEFLIKKEYRLNVNITDFLENMIDSLRSYNAF